MKKIFLFLVTSCLFLLAGCLEVKEDLFINTDGSGKYLITMDMSELFSDPMMKSMINDAAKKETGQDKDAPLEMDSVLFLRNAPEFKQLSASDQDVIKNIAIHMEASESKGKMIMKMDFPFQNLEDFKKMGEVMKKLEKDNGGNGGPGGMMSGGMFGTDNAQFTLKKKVLSRLPMPDPKEILGDNADNLDMMKMFLQEASYTTVYHLPGKVKKTNIPNARIDGNTVTVENNFMDILEGKAKIDGDIKFKNK